MPDDSVWREAIFVLGILILIITIFRMARRRRQRPVAAPVDHRAEAVERVREGRAATSTTGGAQSAEGVATAELSQLLVQIQEIGREIEGRLDTRVRHAQRLLEESDETLYKLQSSIGEAKSLLANAPEGDSVSARDELFARDQSEPTSIVDVRAADRDDAVDDDSDHPNSVAVPDGPVTQDPNEVEIAMLAAEGKSAEAIARTVDRPVGEVRLILSLIESKNRNAS